MKYRNSKVFRLVFSILMGLGLVLPTAVLGQGFGGGQGLTISPFLLERKMEKGETTEEIIEITNTSATELPVVISINDFIPQGDTGEVRYIEPGEGDPRFSLSSWIHIETNPKPTLQPKERTELRFSITPPRNAEEGGHYGAIMFSFKPESIAGSAVAIQQKLGAIILVKLGKAQESGGVAKFSANKNFYEYPPVTFTTRFKNDGNVHVKPRGSITITNMFGRKVGNVLVNKDANNVLANTEREFKSNWDGKWGFGRYSAEVKLVYGDSGQVANAKIAFWIIPWKITLLLAAILVFLIILLTWGLKRYNSWVLSQAYGKRK